MMSIKLYCGDSLKILRRLADCSVQCCVTSPPYWGLRDYGVAGQLGLERTPAEYVAKLVSVFCEVRRILKDDGILWLNLGDSYAAQTKGTGGMKSLQLANVGSCFAPFHCDLIASGLKSKDLVGIPWRVAFALQADGWFLRQDIIWHKPNVIPESVKDRCTRSHEYIFLLAKTAHYYFDAKTLAETSKAKFVKTRRPTRGLGYGEAKSVGGRTMADRDGGFNPSQDGTRNVRSVWL